MNEVDIGGYKYGNHLPSHTHAYLWPTVTMEAENHVNRTNSARRIFDLGCGNGSTAAYFFNRGFEAIGVDASAEGIKLANEAYPHLRLDVGSAYDDLATKYGEFPVVISLEVVEHLYAPRKFASTLFSLVKPGGIAIVSTPYHGYLKNVALAITNKLDKHFTVLWDHGHIKFWSIATLTTLLEEAGFSVVRFRRVGRIPAIAKSMIAIAAKRD